MMEKIWTPVCLPPSLEDLTELSFSALKIISCLQNPKYFKLTTGLNTEKCESRLSMNMPNVSERDKSTATSFYYRGYSSNHLFPSHDQEYAQNEYLKEPASTSLNIYNLNESVDMFEDSMAINPRSKIQLNRAETIDHFDSITLDINRTKKLCLPHNKITDYYPARKKSTTYDAHRNKSDRYGKYDFHICNYSNTFTRHDSNMKKKKKKKMPDTIEGNLTLSQSLEVPATPKDSQTRYKCSEKIIVEDMKYQPNCSISDFRKLTKEASNPFPLVSLGTSPSFNLLNSHKSNSKNLSSDKSKGLTKLMSNLNQKNFDENKNKVNKEQFNDVLYLNPDNSEKASKILFDADLTEIGFTICYSEGFCLLNKPTDKDECSPNGILLRTTYLDNPSEHIFFPSESFKEEKLKMIMINLLDSLTPKVCYETQALILYVLDNISSDDIRACYGWFLLDPLVAVWLLDPDNPPSSFEGLLKYIPFPKLLQKDETWLSKCFTYLKYQSQAMEYLCSRLHEDKLWEVFSTLETKIVPILAVLETSNIVINVEILKKMSTILQEKLNLLENEAETLVGHKFSFKSPQQIRKVLFEELKLDQSKQIKSMSTTTKGEKSTSEPTLKLLGHVHPLPHLILEYRQLWKLKSSYVDIILQLANENKSVTATWELCATATGRITSSSPNLQTIPKKSIFIKMEDKRIELNLRSCFLARKGYIFIAVDFQHIELRMFAHLAKDKRLTDLLNKQDDIFSLMTQVRLKKNVISKEDRDQTKTLVYALMYGAGSKKLANILSVNETEVEDIKNNLLDMFPCLWNFRKKILNDVRKSKVLKSLSGRRRLFPDIDSKNLTHRSSSERKAINFIIQGSAADICKYTMIRIEMKLKDKKVEGRLMLQIHDELLWEVENSSCQNMISLVKEVMYENKHYWREEFDIEIPLPVVISTGYNWGNMK